MLNESVDCRRIKNAPFRGRRDERMDEWTNGRTHVWLESEWMQGEPREGVRCVCVHGKEAFWWPQRARFLCHVLHVLSNYTFARSFRLFTKHTFRTSPTPWPPQRHSSSSQKRLEETAPTPRLPRAMFPEDQFDDMSALSPQTTKSRNSTRVTTKKHNRSTSIHVRPKQRHR